MGPSDDYILVEDAKNLTDDSTTKTSDTKQENNEDSARTLEAQGIFIESSTEKSETAPKHLDDFSRELQDIGGIEIVSSEEGAETL